MPDSITNSLATHVPGKYDPLPFFIIVGAAMLILFIWDHRRQRAREKQKSKGLFDR
ncbi:MAG TPA: hypothetical protein VKY92_10215 [Verrucomicrobiae bacterium]|nr:hypothetical protein [Verrucomicrobiae bacterium]